MTKKKEFHISLSPSEEEELKNEFMEAIAEVVNSHTKLPPWTRGSIALLTITSYIYLCAPNQEVAKELVNDAILEGTMIGQVGREELYNEITASEDINKSRQRIIKKMKNKKNKK